MSEKVSTFPDRLKWAMELKHIKAVDLSRRSGISESMISCYRSGRYIATQVNLQKLAEALDVSIPWLMGYNVPMGKYDFVPMRTRQDVLLAKLEALTPSQLDIIDQMIDAFLE